MDTEGVNLLKIHPLANLGKRYRGQMLDSALVGSLIIVAIVLTMDALPKELGGAVFWLGCIIFFGYILLADGLKNGQSYGKKMIKIAVVDTRTGQPCTYIQSVVRNIFYLLGPVDYIFIFGENKQRLGDIVAHTMVIDLDYLRDEYEVV